MSPSSRRATRQVDVAGPRHGGEPRVAALDPGRRMIHVKALAGS